MRRTITEQIEPLGYQLPPIAYHQALAQLIKLVDGRTVTVREATAKDFDEFVVYNLWRISGNLKTYEVNDRFLRIGLDCEQWPECDKWYALCELLRVIEAKKSSVKLFVESEPVV